MQGSKESNYETIETTNEKYACRIAIAIAIAISIVEGLLVLVTVVVE